MCSFTTCHLSSNLDNMLNEVCFHLLLANTGFVLNAHDDRVSSFGHTATVLVFDILKGHLHRYEKQKAIIVYMLACMHVKY